MLSKTHELFPPQDLLRLKSILDDVYVSRQHILPDSSLAETVYSLSQLDVTDIPNKDNLGLRALARKSVRAWGIQIRRTS